MKKYRVIGLMSGTSLDGLDMVYAHIWKTTQHWEFELLQYQSIAYPKELHASLQEAIRLPADSLLKLHNSYGSWLGKETKKFIATHRLTVDFIASHGHTTHHQPENGLTYQIGSGQHLANASDCTVICDFRSNDVALGGQGAPLVPIGDALLFKQYDFCLNLGGISNISFDLQGKRRAFDIGLANMVLNYITAKIDLAYDAGGALAKKGALLPNLLKALNTLNYYQLPFPKSTGYEWFLKEVVPLIDATDASIEDLLHTCIHHNCEQIAQQLQLYKTKKETSLYVTGGGALNHFFIHTLQEKLGNSIQLLIPPKEMIEFKEALIFAFMGVLRMEKEINVLCSVTGAARDSSSGVMYMPI